jgi:trehalose synthase
VIEAFKQARQEVDATLVLLGNFATDDPKARPSPRHSSGAARSASGCCRRRAAAVVQKSTREGFGLTVTEAMWKGAPVIGGSVGGIRCQIEDGINGFLVSTTEETASRIVQPRQGPRTASAYGGERARALSPDALFGAVSTVRRP